MKREVLEKINRQATEMSQSTADCAMVQ